MGHRQHSASPASDIVGGDHELKNTRVNSEQDKGSNPDMMPDGLHFTDKKEKYSIDTEKAQKVVQSAFQDDGGC